MKDFKKYFSYWQVINPYAGKLTKDSLKRKAIADKIPYIYLVFHHDNVRDITRVIQCSSELAAWRIIDMAIHELKLIEGIDSYLDDEHKVLHRKALALIEGKGSVINRISSNGYIFQFRR